MKRLLLSLLSILFVLSVTAQKGQDGSKGGDTSKGKGPAMFLNKTAYVIEETHKVVKKNKIYTGYLLKAQDKQVSAVALYKSGDMKAAMTQSYAARRLAYLAYEENAGTLPKDWSFNQQEVKIVHRNLPTPPKDDELKAEVSASDKTREAEETQSNPPRGTEKVGDNDTPNDDGGKKKKGKTNG